VWDIGSSISLVSRLLVAMPGLAFLVIAGTVAVTQAQRKIPVQYAKRVVGRKTYGGQSTTMPLRDNYSGVMPIIFESRF
jgi:preprotein translocase subunit SecY